MFTLNGITEIVPAPFLVARAQAHCCDLCGAGGIGGVELLCERRFYRGEFFYGAGYCSEECIADIAVER